MARTGHFARLRQKAVINHASLSGPDCQQLDCFGYDRPFDSIGLPRPDTCIQGSYEQAHCRQRAQRRCQRRPRCPCELPAADHPGRPGLGQAQQHRHPFPAGAQWLPAHRSRQVDLRQLRPGQGIRGRLPPAFRRYQPGQGRPGVHRRHPERCQVAGLRLGRRRALRLRLLRPVARLGGRADQARQGLRLRPYPGAGQGIPRQPQGAGQEQPVPRAQR
ncbi:hypothetical protein D3C72_345540 [compost metagenome]